jgi:phospholipase/lecithinase/hemolysin
MSIISMVSISHALVGASGAQTTALAVQGDSLAATYNWAFLFGPGLVVGFGNGLILGYLMYRSGLLPRRMAMLGLIGGPMLIVSFGLILFGVYENGSGPAALMALPEIAWEGSLGIYAAWKGFRPSPITRTVDIREPSVAPSMATV